MEVESTWSTLAVSLDTDDNSTRSGVGVQLSATLRDHGPFPCSLGPGVSQYIKQVWPHDGVPHLNSTPHTRTSTHKATPALNQGWTIVSIIQTITKFVQRPSYVRLTDAFQDDYHMTDTFHLRPEAGWEDLQDYRPETCHIMLLEKLPAFTTNNPFQGVSDPTSTPGCSVQIPIYGAEVSQSSRYWEFMQTPQLIPSGQSGGVCPCPTRLPPGPNATSEPRDRGPLEVASTESNGYRLPAVPSQHEQPPVPSCDHINCNPPPDVGFLSRRFTENGNWIRARSLAVAGLAYKRRGCKPL